MCININLTVNARKIYTRIIYIYSALAGKLKMILASNGNDSRTAIPRWRFIVAMTFHFAVCAYRINDLQSFS